ncbi:MAG: type II toxin-antitoxin system HicA family toxin [Chitinophagaceae bacterium]
MAKQPLLTAKEAETLLLKAGFYLKRTKGSHKIYMRESFRVVIPFHSGKTLHPKIARQVFDAIELK